MADFLLELLSEEIPARMQARAATDLARLFEEQLGGAGLQAQGIETHATPRRLALIARGLPAETEAVSEEVKGPRAGAPAQAIEGFMRKTGLSREQLVERDGALFAIIDRPGRATAAVLAEMIPAIVRAFPWPKSMRWGADSLAPESLRWVRPLQGIVALLGEEIVEFEAGGVRSGAATVGHRFHHPGAITIGGAQDYAEKLRACHVIVDPEERKTIIRERAAAAAGDAEIVPDEALVAENAGLTEWPVPLAGGFDSAFLELPPELIRLTMRINQKYFACQSQDRLLPRFVCVANIDSSEPAVVIAGNEKVLAARLSDARFFWEHDLKIPLAEHARKLEQIVFHEKLGTVADKAERVAKLAGWMVQERIVTGADPAQVESAARLAKADLGSELVGEFPELQGVIGSYYARAQGQPEAVADAIRDHYRPAGQGDDVPTAPVTIAVNLADRLDTLISFFSIDERPSGSRDPFALRRAALGFLQILTRAGLRVSLSDMLTQAAVLVIVSRMGALSSVTFPDLLDSEEHEHEITAEVGTFTYRHGDHVVVRWKSSLTPNLERGKVIEEANDLTAAVLDFFADRLKVQQREAGVRHDLIDAVFSLGGEDDLVRLLARVKALQAFVETPAGEDLLAGYKRATNILRKENWTEDGTPWHAPSFDPAPEEAALIRALDTQEPKANTALADEEFERAMSALAALRAPVDAFFDKVTVNDPDPGKRRARLNLLARMRTLVDRVADFSRIEG